MMRSPNWSSKILKEETVTSTNDRLAELCQEKEIKEFTTLMAEYQTAGKGQRGNSWESEYGKNLTFSTVFYPQTIAPASQFILSMAVASAICTALAHYVHADCLQIKWPNDIYWKDKKIAGILIENDLTGSQISQSIIGIGININQEEFHSSAPNPVSLRQITQKETDRMEVLNSVLAHIIDLYSRIENRETDIITKIQEYYLKAQYRIQIWVKRSEKIIATETGSVWSPKVLLQDKALLWFTCSGFLASFVSGAFASCISQYVMVIADGDFAEKVVAVVLPVNAAMVVTLQYSVGRRLNPANIRALMTAGTFCFVIGLVGFIFSGNSLLMWGMSAAVFTVGEIIYAPGEYMLIDHIAPPGMKASYFSAQSLGWLGAAINPLVSGIVLTSLPPFSLFIILALVIVVAWVLMLKGIRARPWGQPALC